MFLLVDSLFNVLFNFLLFFLFTKIQKAFVLAILYKILLFMRTYYRWLSFERDRDRLKLFCHRKVIRLDVAVWQPYTF